MRSTMLHTSHPRDAHAKWIHTKFDDAKIQRTRRARGMARRLPNSGQIPARNQHHNNAVRAAHARGLRAALAEEPTARIHQFMESIPGRLHREFQVYVQASSLTRGVAHM